MDFSSIASQSKLGALALIAGGLALAACDSTVEGGGSGGAGGGEESSATGVAQGGGDTGTGGQQSSVSSTSTGPGPGSATSIALFAYELPQGQGGGDVTVSVGSGGAGGEGSSVVAVGAGGADTGVTVGGGEGGYDTSVGQGVTVGGGEGGYGTSGVGGGSPNPGWEQDRLFLFISDDIVECADPYGAEDGCGPRQFRATIGLPASYQQVGIYSLNDPAIISNFSEWEGDGQECVGGGGSFWDGTIEVLSIDASQIHVRLSGTSPADVDGDHTVIRCGSAPQESSVLAFYPSDVPTPGGESSSVTTGGDTGVGGSGPGEENLIIDFADHAQVCADPYGDQPGPGQTFRSLSLHIPPSYLQPGVYSLSDPAIGSFSTEMSENTGVASGGQGGQPGTLTIFEVTGSFIDLQLEGSQYDFANGAGQVPRCN